MQLTPIGLPHFLTIAAFLFAAGLYCVVVRRNGVMVLMGIELILNAANVNFVAFSRFNHWPAGTPPTSLLMSGQVAAIFVIVLAACEAAVALAIVLQLYRRLHTIDLDQADRLRD